ncbi:hypothetical protein ZIOFF_073829 [Zingiber officinale]|uniref:Uncharacterized protein n=1 Tax=Zingiber officinale TaxID=94328 RepID=A0A8J5BZ44_ZINOF|nr:hypothetical protein ZIOFF_073829 [Zingiber officinale]
MEYDHRPCISPPPTAACPKRKHHHGHSLASCFRSAAGDGGQERAESPRRPPRLFHSKARFCFGGGKHRRRHSTEFTYDALSYALNFDEGSDADSPTGAELLRLRCDTSRPRAFSPRDDGADGFAD